MERNERTYQAEDIQTILRMLEKIVDQCLYITEHILNPSTVITGSLMQSESFKDLINKD